MSLIHESGDALDAPPPIRWLRWLRNPWRCRSVYHLRGDYHHRTRCRLRRGHVGAHHSWRYGYWSVPGESDAGDID